jgi:hypothetical protein
MNLTLNGASIKCVNHDIENQTIKMNYCSTDFVYINHLFAKGEHVTINCKNFDKEKTIKLISIETKENSAEYRYIIKEKLC